MKRDLVWIGACGVLLGMAFLATRAVTDGDGGPGADPYDPAGLEVRVAYVAEGGYGPIDLAEVELTGPGEARVRYREPGKPVVETRVPVRSAEWTGLLDLLREVDFLSIEVRRRRRVVADHGQVRVRLRIGDRAHEVAIDGRTEPDRSLQPVLQVFGTLVQRAQGKSGA